MLRWGGLIAIALLLAGAFSLDALSDERCHTYDAQGRLIGSSRDTGRQETWTYDRADNRKTRAESAPGGSCGAPTAFGYLVGAGIGGFIVNNPSFSVPQSTNRTFALVQLADAKGQPATIQSFTLPSGCGTRTIASDGQSVNYGAPYNAFGYTECNEIPPPDISCNAPYVIRKTSTGQTFSGTAHITVPGETIPLPPGANCP